jgi:glutathione reductase (NADPH)
MSDQTVGVLVLGAGMAGLAAARKAASAGERVAIVDTRPYGGTCALRGCDPKKVLVGVADVVDAQNRLRGYGVSGEARIDWPSAVAFKRTFTEPVSERLERGLQVLGVVTLHGETRFVGGAAVEVGGERFTADRFLIATGARPRPLGMPGENLVATGTDFLDLEALPRRILFIGGGYVSFEFAHHTARAGSEATIAHRGARPLTAFDPDHVELLVTASRELGVDVRLGTEVAAVEQRGEASVARTHLGDEIEVDLVVHGGGRIPEIDGMHLDAGGIAFDPLRGVE